MAPFGPLCTTAPGSMSCKYDRGWSPMRLYSVTGLKMTNPSFTWSRNSYFNVSCGCWGLESRFWQVSTGYTPNEFVFKTFMGSITSNSFSFMDELHVRMDQGNGCSQLVYTGIRIGRKCKQFLPLINSSFGSIYSMVLAWAFLEAFVWGGRPFPFLFFKTCISKHRFE